MKIVKKASGKTTIKMSKSEWTNLGKQAGWMNEQANYNYDELVSKINNLVRGTELKEPLSTETAERIVSSLKRRQEDVAEHILTNKHGLNHDDMVAVLRFTSAWIKQQ